MSDVKKKDEAALASYDYGDASGSGFEETTADDFAIPFVSILQAQSPQVMKGKPEYLDGAVAGNLFNTVTGEVYPGEEGLIIVPCCRQYLTVEWLPREKGGGIVTTHDPKSEVVSQARQRATEFGAWKTEEGNDLVDTFYLYCLILDSADASEPSGLPVVITFTSTKIKKYRQAMSKWRAIKGSPPLYAFRVRLRAIGDSNNKGDFYNYELSPAVGSSYSESLLPPDHDVFQAGALFMKQVQDGSMKADLATEKGASESTEPAF